MYTCCNCFKNYNELYIKLTGRIGCAAERKWLGIGIACFCVRRHASGELSASCGKQLAEIS